MKNKARNPPTAQESAAYLESKYGKHKRGSSPSEDSEDRETDNVRTTSSPFASEVVGTTRGTSKLFNILHLSTGIRFETFVGGALTVTNVTFFVPFLTSEVFYWLFSVVPSM